MLSNSGYGTRSTITKMIRSGQVTVNGTVIKDSGYHVKETDEVLLNGSATVQKDNLYFIFDKPDGVLTAMEDKRLPTVADYIPAEIKNLKLSPVGRLDYHTTGLLIITNDGDLSHRLTSPKYKIPKRYLVTYKGAILDNSHIEEAASGMTLTDMDKPIKLAPANLELLSDNQAILTLTEGKTHEVRRIISAWGREVLELRRISLGAIELSEDSIPGTLTELNEEQVLQLKKETGLI
ncbi:MAG: pseudouridine synthase [Saccharofermentans sp.]|nr:pseudouridine synthase [Saccharofermentans sp.]